MLVVRGTACGAAAQDAIEPPPETTPPAIEAPMEPALVPIAVILLPSGDVDAATTDALGELLIAAVASRGGSRIVGKEEIQSQLGQGDATTAECIESIPCLGRLGVALGIREVIAGSLGRRGDSWSFSLNRIDLRTGSVLGRVFREVEGELEEVVRALPESVDDLYVETIAPGRLVVRANVEGAEVSLDGLVLGTIEGGPVRRDLVAPGEHVVVVMARGHHRYERTIDVEPGTTFALEAELTVAEARAIEVPWETWVFGSVAVASVGVAIGLGVHSQSRADASLTMRAEQSWYEARRNEAIAADVLFGVAVGAAVAAMVPAILAALRVPEDEVSLSAAAGPDGAMLTVRGTTW